MFDPIGFGTRFFEGRTAIDAATVDRASAEPCGASTWMSNDRRPS